MKKLIFIIVLLVIVASATKAYAPLVNVVDESQSSTSDDTSSSGSDDTSVVDLSDVEDTTVYSPSLENQE